MSVSLSVSLFVSLPVVCLTYARIFVFRFLNASCMLIVNPHIHLLFLCLLCVLQVFPLVVVVVFCCHLSLVIRLFVVATSAFSILLKLSADLRSIYNLMWNALEIFQFFCGFVVWIFLRQIPLGKLNLKEFRITKNVVRNVVV